MAHKINDHMVKVIEHYQVSPPLGSVPSATSVPLSFLDLPWFNCPPVKRIFFYEFPYCTHHFLQTVLPTLKHSLSLTLQHFFPFAAKVVLPPKPHIPHILYSDADSVSFTVAESTADFHHLVSDCPRDVRDLYPFVPVLPSPCTLEDGTLIIPPMAIQVTVLPNSGFAICITFRHVVADGRAFHNFMKFWASLCRGRGDLTSLQGQGSLAVPCHNRDMIEDPRRLKPIFLERFRNLSTKSIENTGLMIMHDAPSHMVRCTFVLSRDHVEKLKKWVSIKCQSYGLEGTLHISTFVVTCSLIWVCKVKSEDVKDDTVDLDPNNDEENYKLGFLGDCRNIPQLSIPSTYFGNCLVGRCVELKRSKLLGENGIFEAVIGIGSQVRDLQCDALKEAERLMPGGGGGGESQSGNKSKQRMVTIAGSPKLGAYETDFGWGKPKMSEILHIDSTGSLTLSDSRDKDGGVEVGIVLEGIQMKKFNTTLEEQLRDIIIAVHD